MIIGVELGYERCRVGIWRRDSSADGEHVAIYTTRSIVGFTAHTCLAGDAAGALKEIPVVRHVASSASARALDKTWTAEQLLALLLGHLKRRAEDFLEDTVTGVVLGVPADFDAFHVAAVDAAARMAGLEVRRCRPALMYACTPCCRALHSREELNVLICGDDAVYIVCVAEGIAEGLHFVRFDAEASVEQRIHAVEAAHRACRRQLHFVLASEAMRRGLSTPAKHCAIDMDWSTAPVCGAAILARKLGSQYHPEFDGLLQLDVTTMSVGVAKNGVMKVVIPRGPTLLAKNPESFITSVDNQRELCVSIYAGESSSLAQNLKLGDVTLSGLPPLPRGQVTIDCTINLDTDGYFPTVQLHAKSQEEPVASTEIALPKPQTALIDRLAVNVKLLLDMASASERACSDERAIDAMSNRELKSVILSGGQSWNGCRERSELLKSATEAALILRPLAAVPSRDAWCKLRPSAETVARANEAAQSRKQEEAALRAKAAAEARATEAAAAEEARRIALQEELIAEEEAEKNKKNKKKGAQPPRPQPTAAGEVSPESKESEGSESEESEESEGEADAKQPAAAAEPEAEAEAAAAAVREEAEREARREAARYARELDEQREARREQLAKPQGDAEERRRRAQAEAEVDAARDAALRERERGVSGEVAAPAINARTMGAGGESGARGVQAVDPVEGSVALALQRESVRGQRAPASAASGEGVGQGGLLTRVARLEAALSEAMAREEAARTREAEAREEMRGLAQRLAALEAGGTAREDVGIHSA